MSEDKNQYEQDEFSDFEEVAGDGFLKYSLDRSAKDIKRDRAVDIADDIKISYERTIEDLERDLRKMLRRNKSRFDFSPNNTLSLVIAEDVNGEDVVEQDIKAALEIRNLRVKLNEAKRRYNFLFGETYEDVEELI